MKAIEIGATNIALGMADVIVVGGMESMSTIPRYVADTRFKPKPYGAKYGNIVPSKEANELDKFTSVAIDGLAWDGLSDPYTTDPMGTFGVLASVENKVSREEVDDFTLQSYTKAVKAIKNNKFKEEIVKVPGYDLEADEEAVLRGAKITAESLKGLKPAFKLPKEYRNYTKEQFEAKAGVKYNNIEEFEALKNSVTVAGSSTMSDGAATLVLASKEYCEKNGIDYLCTIKGWGQASQEPEKFTSTPVHAAEKAYEMAGISAADIDYFEVNEAFAVVPVLFAKAMDLKNYDKVNVYGGACSLGHPIGCSGARITATLISVLQQEGGKYGCAAICNGGGGASALVLEANPNRKAKL